MGPTWFHEHTWESKKIDATCTETGKTWDVCIECEEIQNEIVLPALGHTLEAKETLPTCIDDGKTWDVCSVCNAIKNEVIVPALGHTLEAKETSPTCTEDGKTWNVCSVCNAIENEVIVPALGHTWATKENPATCTEDGKAWEECSACDAVQNEKALSALGHTWENKEILPTCTEDGKTWEECSACQIIQNEVVQQALGHTLSRQIQEATCTEDGSIRDVCSVCNAIETETVISAFGHHWKTKRISPTCTSDGLIWEECSICETTQNKETLKAEHEQIIRKVTVKATRETDGAYKMICESCNKVISEGIIEKYGSTSGANPDAWNQVVENLINTGKADKEDDFYSHGLEGKEKPHQYMMVWDGSKDNGSKTSELKEAYVLIDSMHKESLGEQCKNQYGFLIDDQSEKSNSTNSTLDPNMTMGIINIKTGEFIFTTVCNDKYYRVLSYDKEQFGKGLEFSNGDGCMVTSKYWSEVGKYAIKMNNSTCPEIAWQNDFQIRFDDAIDTEDYMFFATTCDMDTWLENED